MARQKTLPSLRYLPPGSTILAENQIRAAQHLEKSGDWADALLHLGQVLEQAPSLANDPGVKWLASRLTGLEESRAVRLLQDRRQRRQWIRLTAAPQPTRLTIRVSRVWVLTLLVMAMLLTYMIQGNRHIFSEALAVLRLQSYQSNLRTVDDLSYYLLAPTGEAPEGGWPVLIALHDQGDSAAAMLSVFADEAQRQQIVLIVPDLTQARLFGDEAATLVLDFILTAAAAEQPFPAEGPLLFGHGTGGEIASLYAQSFPFRVKGVVTSGATYLYPPPEQRPDLPYTVMYGSQDALLEGSSESFVTFADISRWPRPLNYLVIPGQGHEVGGEQARITFEVLAN